VPFSLGFAVRRPGESLERTIQRADKRLFEVRAQERQERRATTMPLAMSQMR